MLPLLLLIALFGSLQINAADIKTDPHSQGIQTNITEALLSILTDKKSPIEEISKNTIKKQYKLLSTKYAYKPEYALQFLHRMAQQQKPFFSQKLQKTIDLLSHELTMIMEQRKGIATPKGQYKTKKEIQKSLE